MLGAPPSGASHAPERWPIAIGTRSEPSAVRADCTTTSGLSPSCRVRKTLTMSGLAGPPSGAVMRQMTEVLDCSPVSTDEDDTEPSACPVVDPVAQGVASDGGLRLVGDAGAEDRGHELADVDGVVRAVVDPARAEDTVLHRAEQGVLGALERGGAVGQWHLVDDRGRHGLVGEQQRLAADLALGVLEAEAADAAQLRDVSLAVRTTAGAASTR